MSAEIGHIRPLAPVQTNPLADALEAQRSGALRQLLKKAIQAKSAKPMPGADALRLSEGNTGPAVVRPVAEQQLSGAEQATAFALRGRELDEKRLSRQFREQFMALTTGDDKFLELCIHSLITATEQYTRSMIDDLGSASDEMKTALKFLLLQIAIIDSDHYSISEDTLGLIRAKRDQILEAHNKSLDEFLLTIALTVMASGPLKIGHRQLMTANRMLSKGEDLGSLEIYGFLSRLITSEPKRLPGKLKVLRQQWLLLSDRERTQYPLELTTQRQHFIQSRIRQIDQIMNSLEGIERISEVCKKAGVEKVPDSAKVLLELVGISGAAGVGSANKLTRLFDSMTPLVKGTQIYCINLRNFMQQGLVFMGRQNEKTFAQLILHMNNAIKGTYHNKPVEAEVQ
jgi:hypothetical protein